MKTSQWILLLAFCLVICGTGFVKQEPWTDLKPAAACLKSELNPSKKLNLCGEKISFKNASVADFKSVPGISHKKARHLFALVKNEKNLSPSKILAIKGIGPKTLVKLELSFSY